MKTVSVFGATGSIGQNTLDLIKRDSNAYDVVALTGGRNVALLAADAIALKANVAVIDDVTQYADLKSLLAGSGVEAACGADAIRDAAYRPCDWVISAIVGTAGLAPGWAALEQGKTLALANKESLVTAGPILMAHAKAHSATILPVDSEHSAVFQALIGEDISTVERIIITASGGAFRDWPLADLPFASLAQASNHPNWDMGQRITIDSASMFNKAMELIETKEFFGIRPDQVETIIHPESLIHALVGFNDGALMAHLGPHDMRHAIGFALNWPARKSLPVGRLDLAAIGSLNFKAPEDTRYPTLKIARDVMEEGGLMGAAFTAAKDRALDEFIAGHIGFMDMAPVVENTLNTMTSRDGLKNVKMTLDTVIETDTLARIRAGEAITTLR